MSETKLATVQEFLSLHRIALVGVSRNPRGFSRAMMRELQRRGYDVVPVNPAAEEIEGQHCYPAIAGISPAVEGALIVTGRSAAQAIVQDCWRSGVLRVWLYRGTGSGAVSPEALAFCRDHGVSVVAGECPFMFLPDTGWFHALHGWGRKLMGLYPA